jgi:hypothetical protein
MRRALERTKLETNGRDGDVWRDMVCGRHTIVRTSINRLNIEQVDVELLLSLSLQSRMKIEVIYM